MRTVIPAIRSRTAARSVSTSSTAFSRFEARSARCGSVACLLGGRPRALEGQEAPTPPSHCRNGISPVIPAPLAADHRCTPSQPSCQEADYGDAVQLNRTDPFIDLTAVLAWALARGHNRSWVAGAAPPPAAASAANLSPLPAATPPPRGSAPPLAGSAFAAPVNAIRVWDGRRGRRMGLLRPLPSPHQPLRRPRLRSDELRGNLRGETIPRSDTDRQTWVCGAL
jgi:hypothetical protein